MITKSNKKRYFKLVYLLLILFPSYSVVLSENTSDYLHYKLGLKCKNEKKYEEAINEFRKVLAAYPDNYNTYFQMAEIRFEQKNYSLAIYNLKKALTYNPGWSKAQKMLADAYQKDKQYHKAIVEFQQYQQICDPAERDSIQEIIDRLLNLARGEKTEVDTNLLKMEAVKDSASLKKESELTNKTVLKQKSEELFLEVVGYYNKEQFDNALKKIRELLSISPEHSGAYYYAGLIRYRRKQYDMAIINFKKGLNYRELGINAHFYLGKIYGEKQNYGMAISHLLKYIQKSNYDAGKAEARELIEKYRNMGGNAVLDAVAPGYEKTMKNADSSNFSEPLGLEVRIDSLLAMITIDTLTDAGRKLLNGIHLFGEGKYDEAIKEFKRVMSANPTGSIPVYCLYNSGICYFKLNLFKDAENQFQQILERFPEHTLAPNALFLNGVVSLQKSESANAEKIFRKFIKENRSHKWLNLGWEKLGDAYTDLEQHRKAVDAYYQAVVTSVSNIDKVNSLFKQGRAYIEIENSSKAIECFNKVIEIGEKSKISNRVPDSYYRIADEYYKMKEYEKALEYYTKATRIYPDFLETPWGLFQIGSINKNLKKYAEAIETFKELIKKYPDDYWAREAKWKMEDAIWEYEYKSVLH